jgi:hypothetical protein
MRRILGSIGQPALVVPVVVGAVVVGVVVAEVVGGGGGCDFVARVVGGGFFGCVVEGGRVVGGADVGGIVAGGNVPANVVVVVVEVVEVVVVVVGLTAARAFAFSFFRREATCSAAVSDDSLMPSRRVAIVEGRRSLVVMGLSSMSCGLNQSIPPGAPW